MDQLHQMTVFVAVAEEQSFASAARRLTLSPPAVTRAIATLESSLGVKLFNRTTRHVRTTTTGKHYLEDVRRILAAVQQANESAVGINATPRGRLAVTAPVMFGQRHVVPGITDYLERYPETQVEAAFLDRVVNLLEEGFDIGFRIGHLPDSSLNARKIGQVKRIWVASPGYLNTFGVPQTPQDLQKHRLISANSGSVSPDWQFKHQGKGNTLRLNPRLTVTTNAAAIEAARLDFGITRIVSYQVTEELASGGLIRILKPFEPPNVPIHILYHEGRRASSLVRCFIDLMVERFERDRSLNT
ncbi:LysR family transcriptional regulator [Oleiphilus messinensis]|uniref:LysR family transcriptional regulator n=1 Tax=Oleiphilus messinensis TaxID=141451 RepID=A0A1Y0IFD8_9GAMM|nr:LysR family transcriptional regulator [Oleiphilus messinensis]ARU58084.1 LysR family transcriptional regulator [Oleiphilus messinensis]